MLDRETTYTTTHNPKSYTLPKVQMTKDEIDTIFPNTEILGKINKQLPLPTKINPTKEKKKAQPAPFIPACSCPGLYNVKIFEKKTQIRFHKLICVAYRKVIIWFVHQ